MLDALINLQLVQKNPADIYTVVPHPGDDGVVGFSAFERDSASVRRHPRNDDADATRTL